MQVNLADLKPNPLRDFIVDPIDRATVDLLKKSIHEHGFWGGIACRQLMDGTVEIACGHHRVMAALEDGIDVADVFVRKDVDNAEMMRLYALENGTQRANNTSAAIAGTVASTIHYLAKMIITGVSVEFNRNPAIHKIRGNMQSEKGLGREVITNFLDGIPGITENVVNQQLANLKSSGDYARIMVEVEQEIIADYEAELVRLAEKERAAEARREEEAARQARVEREQAQEAQEPVKTRAKRASTKAAERPKTFDFEGVSKHLRQAHHLDAFRRTVTGPALRGVLAVEDQATLAKRLVDMANTHGAELTGVFLRENITNLLLNSKDEARARTKAEQEELLRRDRLEKASAFQVDFARRVSAMGLSVLKLRGFLKQWPEGEEFPWQGALRVAVQDAKTIIDPLAAACESPDGTAPAVALLRAPSSQGPDEDRLLLESLSAYIGQHGLYTLLDIPGVREPLVLWFTDEIRRRYQVSQEGAEP